MPWIAFVDEEVLKETEKMQGDSEEPLFPEHLFLLACLRLGITIQDLKILTYVDVMKIFLSMGSKKKQESIEQKNVRKATQADIDRLLR